MKSCQQKNLGYFYFIPNYSNTARAKAAPQTQQVCLQLSVPQIVVLFILLH